MLNDKTRQTNILICKYIMDLLKFKYLQCHIATIELENRQFEYKPQRHQISNTFQFTIEEIFKTLETADLYITTANYSTLIETIVNRNFGNTFHFNNGKNWHQYLHKHTSQLYQYISFQISRNFSPPYLKEKCFGCGIGNKEMI